MSAALKKFPLLLSLLLIVYTVMRAFQVAFTSDESITYMSFASAPVLDIITCKYPLANNHLLNSLLLKPLAFFSSNIAILRLPNLLALALFLYSGTGISRFFFKDHRMQALAFLIFCLNPMLYEFFGLCRGYGLSIGLLSFALLQLLRYSEDAANKRSLHLALLAAVLSVFAMLSNLMIVLIFIFFTFLLNYRNDKGKPNALLHSLRIPFLYFLLLIALCANPIRVMSQAGELYYGGQHGFQADTVTTFLENLAGKAAVTAHHQLFCALLYTLFFLSVVFIAIFQLKHKTEHRQAALLILLMLGMNIAGMNIAFLFLKIPLPLNRSSLYLYPLLAILFMAALSLLYQQRKLIAYVLSLTVAALLTVSFVLQMNISRTAEWWFDASAEQAVTDMVLAERSKIPQPKNKIRFFCNWQLSYSASFYVVKCHPEKFIFSPWIMNCREAPMDSFDYVYIMASDECQPQANFKKIKEYGEERKLFLYQNQHTLRQPADSSSIQ